MSRHWIWGLVGVVCIAVSSIADVGHAAGAKSWRLLSSTPAFPPALAVPVGVYDAARQRVLVIEGNWSYSRASTVVWAFTPGGVSPHWATIPIEGDAPVQRYVPAVVLDPVRDRLLVIGMASGTPLLDVGALQLSGTPRWQRLPSGEGPGARYGQSAVHDAAHDRLVVFGGVSGSAYLSDVWLFSLATNTWTHVPVSGPAPEGREGHGALYDPVLRRMVVFGGHTEAGITRRFFADLWALSLDDSLVWTKLEPAGAIPGARSAFGTVYDPVRRRMLVHGGINAQSGIEPDDLWALALDGAPAWTPIVPANTLRGRSYPVDVYDAVADRLLACGGGGYPQTSALSLAAPIRWTAVDPPVPLPAPSARADGYALYDTRRDRFLVVGGSFSAVDSATWLFAFQRQPHWEPMRSPGVPLHSFHTGRAHAIVADSLGDRLLLFDGWQVQSESAAHLSGWTELGPPMPQGWSVGSDAGIAVDTRRNRLIITGGWVYWPHGAGYSMSGIWALNLGPDPTWSHIGELPFTSYGHAVWYDAALDRLVVLGGEEVHDLARTRHAYGAVVWVAPLDSLHEWRKIGPIGDAALPAPPHASAAFDARGERLFLGIDSTLWTRGVDDTTSWRRLELTGDRPMLSGPLAFDPRHKELIALFGPLPGSDRVNAWSLVVRGRKETGHQARPATTLLEGAPTPELLGSSPSPALGSIRLALRLPDATGTRLEVFDLLGRRRFGRDVGSLGAGTHTVTIDGSERWNAGVYFARLQRGADRRTMRVVLIR